MTRRSTVTRVFAYVAVALCCWSAAPVSGQAIMEWRTPKKVLADLEDGKAGLLFFDSQRDNASTSYNFNFAHPQVVAVARKFSCARIVYYHPTIKEPWGEHAELARGFGVGSDTALVFLASDGTVLTVISNQLLFANKTPALLKNILKANSKRKKDAKTAASDLDRVEKWTEAGSFANACRRVEMVRARGDKLSAKLLERAEVLRDRLVVIAIAKLEEAEALIEQDNVGGAQEMIQNVQRDFGKLDDVRERAKMLQARLDREG